MVWLRHELWETHDGPSYVLASRAETDRRMASHDKVTLQEVFYAPSHAAAEAIYRALRLLGPYTPDSPEAETPYTAAQLEAQRADFPDDEYLARRSPPPAAHPVSHAHDPIHAGTEPNTSDAQSDLAHDALQAPGPADAAPEAATYPGSSTEGEHAQAHAQAHGTAPSNDTSSTAESSGESHFGSLTPRPLGGSRRSSPSRSNPFVVFLRVVLLLIVVAGVVLALGLVTGALDGPTVQAEAQKVIDGSLWETIRSKLGI